MKVKTSFFYFVFLFCFFTQFVSGNNIGEAGHNSNDFTIQSCVDLKGDTLCLPYGTVLKFSENGSLKNGVIFGNNNTVEAEKKPIFYDIEILGNWNNKKVYGEWCSLSENNIDNNTAFKNIMSLCNGKHLTHLYISRGTLFVSAIKESAPIVIPSNVYWHNEATIRMRPTSFSKYNVVLLNKVNNVTIEGGHIEGDVVEHIGKKGEWGHGIKCGGASNIVLRNLSCNYCWGDGIDLIEGRNEDGAPIINCNNVLIDNVKCLNNRRQGISIEAASNVVIRNSLFSNTGFPFFTSPGAGIDIEPWNDNSDKVWNVRIEKCSFHNNRGYDIQCEPNIKKQDDYKKLINNIEIVENEIEKIRVQYSKKVKIKGCKISKELRLMYSDGIELRDCYVHNLVKGKDLIRLKEHNNHKYVSSQNKTSIVIYLFIIMCLIIVGVVLKTFR